MTARPASMRRSLGEYVDQVKRKEQFLAEHPDASIVLDLKAPPHSRWRGHVPGCAEVTSHELSQVLDQMDDLVAAGDAHARWSNWTFTHKLSGWQASTATNRAKLESGVEGGGSRLPLLVLGSLRL
jgi:hypothetical protein